MKYIVHDANNRKDRNEYTSLERNLLINLKDKIFEPAVGSLPNLARMCP